MKARRTSRVLNDHSYFLGISYSDITAIGLFLLGLVLIGKSIGISSMLWALMAAASVLTVLIPVRLKYRRRIIRDFSIYLFQRGTIHVSKNHRK